MGMNIAFLVGGLFVGYLIRGEVNRRKTSKAVSELLNLATEVLNTFAGGTEEKEPETKEVTDNIINISNDETIKL